MATRVFEVTSLVLVKKTHYIEVDQFEFDMSQEAEAQLIEDIKEENEALLSDDLCSAGYMLDELNRISIMEVK